MFSPLYFFNNEIFLIYGSSENLDLYKTVFDFEVILLEYCMVLIPLLHKYYDMCDCIPYSVVIHSR